MRFRASFFLTNDLPRFQRSGQHLEILNALLSLPAVACEDFRSSGLRRDSLFRSLVRTIRKPQLQLADALIAYYLK